MSYLESFVADAAVAAVATSVASEAATQVPPPPPSSSPSSPPPPRLVANYSDSPASGLFSVVNARAALLCAAIAFFDGDELNSFRPLILWQRYTSTSIFSSRQPL